MADKSIQLAGGNNITLSTAAAADITSITISGANAGGAQTGISSLANSETTYTSGQVRLSGTNNITLFSTTGQAFVISGANTHAQQTAISGIQNTQTTYTSGTVELEGTNNITVFSTTGQRFRISGANTHAQQTGISAVYDGANSISSGTIRLTNANNVTFTINGQTLSGSVHAQQTGISGLQNTETTYTSGTVELEGTNNITVFSTTGQRFRISGANTHAQQTAISGIANSETTYTSGTVQLVDLANITIRSTTGQKYEFSVAAPGGGGNFSAGVSNLGNTAGDTGKTGTHLVLVGTNAVSLSQSTNANGGTVSFNVTHTTHGHTDLSIGVSTGGNTSGDTTVNTGSRFVVVGTNNITASQGTAAGATTVTLSGPNTHAQQTGVSALYDGANSISSGTVRLTNANNITFTINGQTLSGSVHPPETAMSVGVSNLGNTGGDTTVNVGSRLVFRGSNNVTLSQTTAAGATTIGFNAPSGGVGGGGWNLSLSTTAGGATTGTMAEISDGTVTLFAGNDITLSQSGTSTVVISAAQRSLNLTGVSGISVSTSSDGSSTTASIIGGGEVKFFYNMDMNSANAALTEQAFGGLANSVGVYPLVLKGQFPGNMTVNTLAHAVSLSNSTATASSAKTFSWMFALYTMTGSTLSLLNSAVSALTHAADANNSNSYHGRRWITFGTAAWSSNPVLSEGDYWIATMHRSSGQSLQTAGIWGEKIFASNSQFSGTVGAASQTATSIGILPFFGIYGTSTTAFPASIVNSQVMKTQPMAFHMPLVIMAKEISSPW